MPACVFGTHKQAFHIRIKDVYWEHTTSHFIFRIQNVWCVLFLMSKRSDNAWLIVVTTSTFRMEPKEIIKWFKTLKSLIFDQGIFAFDFSSDIVNGVQLIRDGHPLWGASCLILTAFPSWILGLSTFLDDKDWLLFLASLMLGWLYIPMQTIRGWVVQA